MINIREGKYRWFVLTTNYHNAIFTMLHEIESSIVRDSYYDMDDEYLRQTVQDALRAAIQLREFER